MRRSLDEVFHASLESVGFKNDITKSYGSPDREQAFSRLLHKVQLAVNEQMGSADPEHSYPPVVLIGQEHNNRNDHAMAQRHASRSAEQQGRLLLERNGVIHPGLPNAATLRNLGGAQGGAVAIEDEFYTTADPLSGQERSKVMGLYIANSLAYEPNRPVTVIFGENHLQEIESSTNAFLKQMKLASAKFEVVSSQPEVHKSAQEVEFDKKVDGIINNFNKSLGDVLLEQQRNLLKPTIKHFLQNGGDPDELKYLATNLKQKKIGIPGSIRNWLAEKTVAILDEWDSQEVNQRQSLEDIFFAKVYELTPVIDAHATYNPGSFGQPQAHNQDSDDEVDETMNKIEALI